jgi:hypothetical protein
MPLVRLLMAFYWIMRRQERQCHYPALTYLAPVLCSSKPPGSHPVTDLSDLPLAQLVPNLNYLWLWAEARFITDDQCESIAYMHFLATTVMMSLVGSIPARDE